MKKSLKAFAVVIMILMPLSYALSHSSSGWTAPEESKKIKNPVPSTAESVERAKKNYIAKCQVCHGDKGDGKGILSASLTVKPANFTDREMMDSMTDGEIFWKMGEGKGAMPSWKETLKENERWDLVNLIRTFSSPGEEK